ncbi:hypothetical protein FOA43_003554 [Brettanomyces nanus]|uniref:Uncharacterized protein n=1 Tax=Eeniella nana TaxID=13502 RepID=A0A875S5D0_EENNA|nr:uncharacterized protein FOA43_003554 [Brettanomyces nanus]QPG76168.1 hypothetical protein FOA43_003554 [Brettanomyces nanus]
MAYHDSDIPSPKTHLHTLLPGIPDSIMDVRATISEDHLMNATHIIFDYINQLCTLASLHDHASSQTLKSLLETAKTIQIFKTGGNCPWNHYERRTSDSSEWSVYDEIMVCVVSECLLANQITFGTLSKQRRAEMTDDKWKKSHNLLKLSFTLLNSFRPLVEDTPAASHKVHINYAYHSNTILTQFIVIMKNLYQTSDQVDSQFGVFDKLPSNVGTYRKIIIFIYNEYSVLGSIGQTSYLTYIHFLEIIYCYYSAVMYYKNNELGIALGLVQYGLLNAVENNPIKSKLKIWKKKNQVNTKGKLKEGKLLDDKVHLSRQFTKDFPPLYQSILVVVSRLLEILYFKFSKMNEIISFSHIVEPSEIQAKYLFKSSDLPAGLQVPPSGVDSFIPDCIQTEGSSSALPARNYF